MGKKKRQKKSQSDVLNSPISYGLGFLKAGAIPRDQLSADEQAEIAAFQEQISERMRAVYEYFRIDSTTASAKDDLILAMCFKLFPDGFSLRGGKKRKSKAGNTRQWTIERKLALIHFVEELASAGIEMQAIFKLYGDQQNPLMSADSVKARFSEAKKTLETDFKSLDLADQLELLKMYEDFLEVKKDAELSIGTEIK